MRTHARSNRLRCWARCETLTLAVTTRRHLIRENPNGWFELVPLEDGTYQIWGYMGEEDAGR